MLIGYSDQGVLPVTLHDQIAAEFRTCIQWTTSTPNRARPALVQLQQYDIVVAFTNSAISRSRGDG